MTKEKEILEALRHSRHDWLNVIQLIKGNLAMKRYDRIEEVLESITQQTLNESKLSNLRIPALACHLLTFNWYSQSYKLEFEVIGDVCDLSSLEKGLEKFVIKGLELFTKYSSSENENHLLLTFQLFPTSCRLTFDYQGTIDNQKAFLTSGEQLVSLVDGTIEMNGNECVLSVGFEKK